MKTVCGDAQERKGTEMETSWLEEYTADMVSHVIVNAARVTAENDGLALRFFSHEDGGAVETVAVVPWVKLRAFVDEIMRVGGLGYECG
jgi:hypothetical protein